MNTQLEDRLGQALHELAGDGRFAIDFNAIESRARRARIRTAATGGGVALTVAAVAAAAVGLAGPPQHAPASRSASPSVTSASSVPGGSGVQLSRLAEIVLASDTHLSGDATKVIRTTTLTGKAPTVGADLFADDGDYFYSDDPAGLPAQVTAHNNLANGVFGRDVAAAEFAANGGDLATAQERMAVAAFDPGTPYRFVRGQAPSPFPPGLTGVQKKEYVEQHPSKVALVDFSSTWSNSLDALIAGAGRPDVRAGVIRILSTLPNVTVDASTTDGKPTLTISESDVDSSGTYVETLIIGAKDGVPVRLIGGDKGLPTSVTVAYQVSRETLSTLS